MNFHAPNPPPAPVPPYISGERREVLEVLEGIAKLLGLSRRMDHIIEALDAMDRKLDVMRCENVMVRADLLKRLEGLR